jgi:hypothetical protein
MASSRHHPFWTTVFAALEAKAVVANKPNATFFQELGSDSKHGKSGGSVPMPNAELDPIL